MNDLLAHERLGEVLAVIDQWGDLYDRRWGHKPPNYEAQLAFEDSVNEGIDDVRIRVRFAHDVIVAMGEKAIATKVVEHGEPYGHPFGQARVAILEAIAILRQREELAEVVGPNGPRFSASELHPAIWGAAARLWDDGHYRQAVQTSASALEGLLQAVAGPDEAQ